MASIEKDPTKANGINGTNSTNGHIAPPSKTLNAWSTPGPAAFDFRSDVVTTPTRSMLTAIENTTLLDDVFNEDPTTISLQADVASLTGHPAALLVLSGTMGNQLSVRTHLTQPPHSLLLDPRSHIYSWEAGFAASLSGALCIPVSPSNTHHLTLPDIKKHAVLSTDVHACPTRLIALENTLNGTILPLSDCRAISTWAHAQEPPIPLHLDGARLWEAVAAGAGSLKDYCACFDSISLCFSKGLGAPIGSMIVGSEPFITKARWLRKGLGGGLRQAGVITAAAQVAVQETFLGGLLGASHRRAEQIADLWVRKGGRLLHPCETNMVWLDLEAEGWGSPERVAECGVRHGVKIRGGRLVVHYQIGEEAVARLGGIMDEVLGVRERKVGNGDGDVGREVEAVLGPEME